MSRILLIEDDQYIGNVYERAFRLAEHEIAIETDGEAAWVSLSTKSPLPDIILLDLTLPKMSGRELFSKIKSDVRFDGIPVVVLTNVFDRDTEKELLAAGAELYLVKIDYKPHALLEKIDGLIHSHSPA